MNETEYAEPKLNEAKFYTPRIRRVLLSPELAMMWLKGIDRPYITDLPADAELIEMRLEPLPTYNRSIAAQSAISFLVRSDSFEPVEQGAQIPELNVTCTVGSGSRNDS